MTSRQFFFNNLAQTSPSPLSLEIERAEGIHLYDTQGKKYIDLISGISVSYLGHGHSKVIEAVKKQVDTHMYLMVYGEYIQSPQVHFARLLSQNLPHNLSCVYFVNSGTEATEGAMKLAKKSYRANGDSLFRQSLSRKLTRLAQFDWKRIPPAAFPSLASRYQKVKV